ncbi:TPA: phage head morphogenesis protein, partial [Streptococcus agalactiae]|nr:phage head morphogenesis protein [Streptococcus agalactiae]
MDMHTKEGKSYWRKRVKKEMEAKDKKDIKLGKSMKQIHDYHFREIEKEIESFYQRYADKEAIDLKLAKKAVSDVDINAYQKKAKELVARANEMRKEGIKVTKANFTHQENIDMAVYNLKMKVNALELLQLNIDLAMQSLSEDEYKATKK